MFRIPATNLAAEDAAQLASVQASLDAAGDYAARVAEGKRRWAGKPDALFGRLRKMLEGMCSGNIRCIYCEDSRADEIEHMRPKDLYPEAVFVWDNYVLACGPCNGPKNNHFAVIAAGTSVLIDVTRKPRAAVAAPAAGVPALIDPRAEDPLDYLWLDFRTYRFVPNAEDPSGKLRAKYTIDVLRLNERDDLVRGRSGAYSGFRARLKEYCAGAAGWSQSRKVEFLAHFRGERYRTVWLEMIRQRNRLAEIDGLLQQAPEALAW